MITNSAFSIVGVLFAMTIACGSATINVMAQWPQPPTSALFIGNSYTFYNDLPGMVRQLAQAGGHELYVESHTPGGYTFQLHSADTITLSKIRSRPWDVVVLQEQSQRPAFPPSQVQNEVFAYARILIDSIRAHHPCARTVFYMTWGRENGDQQNCPFYPPICTYEGMQARLRSSYIEMAEQNAAWTAPVGAAWRQIRTHHPEIMLYAGDQSHPSLAGSYLAACVIYSTIFGSQDYAYTAGLNPTTYTPLQDAARSTVFDSLNVWKIGAFDPRAGASHVVYGDSVVFHNLSVYADAYFWDFGDGNHSSAPLPTHVYTMPGDYFVSLTASNQCLSDVFAFTVTVDSIPNDTVPNDTVPNDTVPNDTVPNFRTPLRSDNFVKVMRDAAGRWIWRADAVRFRVYLYDTQGKVWAIMAENAPWIEAEELPKGLMLWHVPGLGSGKIFNLHEK